MGDKNKFKLREVKNKMALPLEIFVILVLAGLICLVFGVKNIAHDNGISFLIISGILFLVTGLFLWNSGLQLPTIQSMDLTGDVFTPTYVTLVVEEANYLWVLSYTLILGGLISILISLGNTAGLMKFKKVDALESREEFF
jgi:hypothetical protein